MMRLGDLLEEFGRGKTERGDAGGEVEVTLKLAKNRNGSAGKQVHLWFHGALQKFREG